MRFFKHGDVLAVSLPESLRQKLGINENDEYDFLEIQDGVLALVKKGRNFSAEKVKQNLAQAKGKDVTNATDLLGPPKPAFPFCGPEKTVPFAAVAKPAYVSSTTAQPNKPASFASTGTALDRQGFLVLSTEDEAKSFSQRFESQIKAGDTRGVRGFDKKFYLASRTYSETYAGRLLVVLKEPKSAPELAAEIRQPLDGVLTLLNLLKEEGEVIEKKRGLFARVF